MKFGRYLQDTQTPEWKKAYIDYRALKKLIAAIRNAQEDEEAEPLAAGEGSPNPSGSIEIQDRDRLGSSSQANTSGYTPRQARNMESETAEPPAELSEHILLHSLQNIISSATASDSALRVPNVRHGPHSSDFGSPNEPAEKSDTPGPGFLTALRRRHTTRTHHRKYLNGVEFGPPLFVILTRLRPLELKYIEKLDIELEKVETFYVDKEREATQQAAALERQLRELEEHRQLVQDTKDAESTWRSILNPRTVVDRLPESHGASSSTLWGGRSSPAEEEEENNPTTAHAKISTQVVSESKGGQLYSSSRASHGNGSPPLVRRRPGRLDTDEYRTARKNIRKAILEYYKFLELLNNFRVLNLTGFRKALKKFEKTVKISGVQQAYMQEKVEVSAFASGEAIEKLLKEIEDQYAQYFEYGDMKKARERLRANMRKKHHHSSTFRTGLYLGIAVPPLVHGIYQSFRPEIRVTLPWSALLYVYASFLIPLVSALLVGVNIWVWSRSRINYQFIFELNVRTQLDSREYFELPAFFLSTLIYAFWLSFAQIGTSNVAPTTWPIAWLIFALVMLFDPLPVMYSSSRWWFTRKVGKLFISGMLPVQFSDFWIGDQMSSLIFSLSNLYFVGCVYEETWQDPFSNCNVSVHWAIPFAVGALPLAARASQSMRRYIDSRLYTHLVNASKYILSIVYYLFYYLWRHHNRKHDGFTFVLFCFFGTLASIYFSAWDILMDWSLFKRPAKHRFLRKDLVYENYYPVYYFAIITNTIARFQWVLYLSGTNDELRLRTFIVALIEMLRRFQWNFFRLENEHIGNTDQYRATREMPLPYDVDQNDVEENVSDAEEEERKLAAVGRRRSSNWRRKLKVELESEC